jgi:hypothetical protein
MWPGGTTTNSSDPNGYHDCNAYHHTDRVSAPSALLLSPTVSSALCRWLWKLALVAALTATLLLTYEHCIVCVVCVSVLALLTLNCVPLMPLVFALSVGILVWHSVDIKQSTVRVEIPLNNLIYVPSYSDIEQYVHFQPGATPVPIPVVHRAA